ncbi:hypothetical protein HYT84_01330 [Candidatus Micrarchaeota archaeon]|nr:hypothetical protein [Candidatus Micrarchaeota archaeon]
MINFRKLEKRDAVNERVELIFYKVIEKDGKRMLKPLDIKTSVPIGVVKAVWDNTIVETFYERLANDLRERGIEEGTLVQLRVKFSASNTEFDPGLKGIHVLCEVKV